MSFWIITMVWATLSLLTIRRLQVILFNFGFCLQWHSLRIWGRRVVSWPRVRTLRPLRQLLVWFAEVWLLLLWYQMFGPSIAAHLVAAISALGVCWLLRDRAEANPLRAIQVVPMR